jgi:hypothetical protein
MQYLAEMRTGYFTLKDDPGNAADFSVQAAMCQAQG